MDEMINTGDGMRIAPSAPVNAYKTFQIIAPLSTHFREASCEEVNCGSFLNGFRSVIDESTELGQQQAHYIRKLSRRKFTEEKQASGLTVFTFESGQNCFTKHQTRLERPEHFVVRDGDWRGNPTGKRYVHTNSELWVEDFADHQENIKRVIERG